MIMENGTTTIEVKLLRSGQYLWTISRTFSNSSSSKDEVSAIKHFDTLLKEEYPDYVKRGSGRAAAFDEND